MTTRLPNDERRRRTHDLLRRAATASEVERVGLINEVVEVNLQVAEAVARRFRDRGIPLEDLEQVGAVALVRAAQKFDLGQDRDFLSYAVPTMSGEIKRYFRDHGWTIRPPRRIQEIQAKVTRMYETGHEDGRPMSIPEVAAALELPVTDVEEAIMARGLFHPASLDQPARSTQDRGEANSIADLIAEDEGDVAASEARITLAPVLRKLSERDRRILQLRFAHDQTQQEIGDELGVTQMQVSRLIERILRTLRSELERERTAAQGSPERFAGTALRGAG